MIESVQDLLHRYKRRGALLDSNLLLLLLVGLMDVRAICRFEHTKEYSVEDYERLRCVAEEFDRMVTLPHVLTEVSNLATKLRGSHRQVFPRFLAEFLADAEEDRTVSGRELSLTPTFATLGLPDSAILAAVRQEILLLTADDNLTSVAADQGCAVLPFYLLKQLDS